MLVLKLKLNESIHIGNGISVMLLRSCGTGCRVGIEAPRELAITRDVHFLREQAEQSHDIGGEGGGHQ